MMRTSLVVLLAVLVPVTSAQQQNSGSPQVYVVPFSHLDLYWACTQEECLDRGNFIIGKATQLAMQSRQYRYLLETNVFVSDFASRSSSSSRARWSSSSSPNQSWGSSSNT